MKLPEIVRGPVLLTHPQIPQPLYGLTPRSLKGSAWWDQVRQEAYKKYDFTCWACGVHKLEAKFHKWLEAHEYYVYDFGEGKVYYVGAVALCHSCHNFIHGGRMVNMLQQGKFKLDKYYEIIAHGMRVLYRDRLLPHWSNIETIRAMTEFWGFDEYLQKHNPKLLSYLYQDVFPMMEELRALEVSPTHHLVWSDWRLIFEGKEYSSLWESQDEMVSHYRGDQVLPEETLLNRFREIYRGD